MGTLVPRYHGGGYKMNTVTTLKELSVQVQDTWTNGVYHEIMYLDKLVCLTKLDKSILVTVFRLDGDSRKIVNIGQWLDNSVKPDTIAKYVRKMIVESD